MSAVIEKLKNDFKKLLDFNTHIYKHNFLNQHYLIIKP